MSRVISLLICSVIVISSCTQQKKMDVTYIANAGFLIESNGKQVIIDALFKQGWGNYLIPTDSIVSDIITQQPPFNNSNLMLITHDHADHFNASMVVDYLIINPDVVLIAPPGVTNTISKHPDYMKFKNQIVELDKMNPKEEREFTLKYIKPKNISLTHIPPAEIEIVKDSVKQINDFVDVTVFENSMSRRTFFIQVVSREKDWYYLKI